MKKTVALTCDECHNDVELPAKDIIVIFNDTYGNYTYAFTHCGIRQAKAVSPENSLRLIRAGATLTKTEAPKLSRRPWGPPLDEVDVEIFIKALATHDHLAAYAGG